MILLVTNKRDITTDFIVLELKRRCVEFIRLNTEDLSLATVRFRPHAIEGWEIDLSGRTVKLRDVRGAYYRRPGVPGAPAEITAVATRDYIVAEWSAVLRSIWNALDGRWLNSPFAILRAEDKPRQLTLAIELGFDVPGTLIGNDFESARDFTASRRAISKPLRHALVERGPAGEVLFTSRVASLIPDDCAAVELAPVIYQQEVRKAYDIRATVIGERVFAVAIHSQQHPETETDWRSGTRLDLKHEPITLPTDVAAKCISLTKALGLRYGAVDLIADTNGRHWFLEINPNGQWAWIERRAGIPLAAAIVDELMAITP